ncbi:oxamate carbamoyltransferase subunit AllH family protein, partial [Actinomadura napierensis]|uniref:oxamate carbamoyltransferase subunit AllH family protein n=1 Tax=Actinomadura napierensis TaxID=267854 RepID=UPI0031D6A927
RVLHWAGAGGAGGEIAAVLRCVAGHEPPSAAVRRLLAIGHTSGTDLAWGVLAGCRAALALTSPARRRPAENTA